MKRYEGRWNVKGSKEGSEGSEGRKVKKGGRKEGRKDYMEEGTTWTMAMKVMKAMKEGKK